MMDECRYCGSGRTVPVLDVRMEGQPHGGNPYRSRCLGCSRWLPMASKQDFKDHLHPHVLPKDGDPESDDDTIPLEEWDRAERFEGVVERLAAYRDRDRPYAVATDGGTDEPVDDDPDQDDPAGSVMAAEDVDDQDDDQDDDPVNRFDCPACGADVGGYPDECPECGAPYNWD